MKPLFTLERSTVLLINGQMHDRNGRTRKDVDGMMSCRAVVLVFILGSGLMKTGAVELEDDALFRYLHEDKPTWRPWIRPVLKNEDILYVNVSFVLSRIEDVNEKTETFTAFGWLSMDWYDPTMTWDPHQFNGIDKTTMPQAETWTVPAIFLNSVGQTEMINQISEFDVTKSFDGVVNWPPGISISTYCNMDLTYFPYDEQTCNITVTNWQYPMPQLRFVAGEADISNLRENNQWQLTRITMDTGVFSPAVSLWRFSKLDISFHIRRRPLFFTLMLVLPCLVLSLLSMLTFLLSPASGEKVSLALAVLTVYTVFLLLVLDILPQTSVRVPVIVIYLSITTGMMGLSIVMTVLVSRWHYQEEKMKIPKLLRIITFKYMAFLSPCKLKCDYNKSLRSSSSKYVDTAAENIADGIEKSKHPADPEFVKAELTYDYGPGNKVLNTDNKNGLRPIESQEPTCNIDWISLAIIWDRFFLIIFIAMFIMIFIFSAFYLTLH